MEDSRDGEWRDFSEIKLKETKVRTARVRREPWRVQTVARDVGDCEAFAADIADGLVVSDDFDTSWLFSLSSSVLAITHSIAWLLRSWKERCLKEIPANKYSASN